MGLDMYIYKVSKIGLEKRTYTSAEIRELGLTCIAVDEANEYKQLYADLLPYTIKRDVSAEFLDMEKIIADYHLPSNSSVGMMSYEKITVSGKNDNGEYIRQEITRDEIDNKYTVTKTNPYYIWKDKQVAYWRKHYDLQDWIYDELGNVDNTGYYMLNTNVIQELNDTFDEDVPVIEPTKDSALFYWEWY